ncbi:MAG: hypothetical protein LBH72_04885 [Proteiniphilum sp.]|jgi:hypothetical protein|nr:hypothetical protein [Proteiniphilum sp.]
MNRIYLTLLLLTLATGAFSQKNRQMDGNHYASEWAKVAELEEKSLPRSASEAVNSILHKAVKDRNTPQIIKALIHQGKYDLATDSQNDTLIFRNLHAMLEKSDDAVEQSVLHSMLGELYLQYYRKDRRNIDRRTGLGDFVPADMKEWTRNIFYNKAIEHLNASLQPEEQLQKTEVESCAAVIESGKDSRKFYPSMYDFLIRRAIELSGQIDSDEELSRLPARKNITPEALFAPADEFVKLPFDPRPEEWGLWRFEYLRKHLHSLLKRDMPQSVLLTELDKISTLEQLHNLHSTYAQPSLERMLKKWEGKPLSVEIIDRLCEICLREIHSTGTEDTLRQKEKTGEVYEILKKSIAAFPQYERISMLENRLLELTQPEFSVTGENTFPKEGKKELQIQFRNIRTLTAKLYRIESSVETLEETMKAEDRVAGKRTLIGEIPLSLPDTPEYLYGKTSFTVEPGDFGYYILTFAASPEISDAANMPEYYFTVSDLAVFARKSSDSRYDFFVVNRITGAPVPGAEVMIYKQTGNPNNSPLTPEQSLAVNDMGLAVYEKKIPDRDVFYHAVAGNDKGSVPNRLPSGSYRYSDSSSEPQETTNIFTDRSLYRPGQTVYFKAVHIRTEAGKQSAVAGKTLALMLRDANGREISKQTLTTNEFGSVAGEFVLPQHVMPGYFTLGADRESTGFRVEEYRRPSFEVTFDRIDETYKFGEEITLKGKAESFSGISLRQAGVEYRITRRPVLWWQIWGGTEEHFAAGNVITGEDGSFEISFVPEKPDSRRTPKAICSFVAEASVTDVNGETQTASYTVTVGDVSMMLSLDMPDRWAKESEAKITVSAKNLAGNDIAAGGICRIFSLQENDSIGQIAAESTFEAGEQPALKKQLAGLPSGKYRLKLQSEDDRGNPVETEKDIILFSYSDKRPPIKTNEWFVVKNSRFAPGKDAEVILGVSEKVHVLYELWQGSNLLERKWIGLDNESRLFRFPRREEYKEGITLMLTYVKNEEFYTRQTDILPEKENGDLKVKLDVFRDRIRPGAEEEWRITVTGADGNPAPAEVLASMYDFSLDNIYPSQEWTFSSFPLTPYFSRMRLSGDRSFYGRTAVSSIPVQWKEIIAFEFDSFNWFGYSLLYAGGMRLRSALAGRQGGGMLSYSAPVMKEEDVNEAEFMVRGISAKENKKITPNLPASLVPGQESEAPQVRRNFNETAFFFPHLRTGERGEVQIAFTTPESNTRWRFRVLAHDRQMNSGKTEAFTVSQKELMVTPGVPRFLRQGDRTAVSAKISNLSDSTVSGSVRLEFFDPVTEESLGNISLAEQEQLFTLQRGASSDAWWTFDVPTGADLLGVRIVARSEQFSDGEQHALAVLPGRMLVTESMRMDVKGNETKEFVMEGLLDRQSKTAEDYRLTLEFASNPAWYAVQALPALGEPESDNAVSWFASCYANMLGAHIGEAFPKVKAMAEAWKRQGGDRETFFSNLERNRELKSALLEETPWVSEARNEAEQRERLSLLFDLNRSRDLTAAATDRLKDLQTEQGGWSWFKGFSPSVSITQYILYGFHRLKEVKAGEFPDEILEMQKRAVSYTDMEAIRRFEALKRHDKKWKGRKTIPVIDLEYLYVRSAYAWCPQDGEAKDLTDFYLSVVERNWTRFGLYERSLIAILMSRLGKNDVVDAILNSFREHAVRSDETGMYWANNRAQVFMSQSAVSVHTFIMDAFRAGGAGAGETDEMKRWLLKQKQTQLWETSHATVDAVYALLSAGSDWFAADGGTAVSLGKHRLEPESRESGSGYFKESWSRGEIPPEMGRVTVVHQGDTPAWGALYRQYFEELDRIGKTDASLDVEKQLFVEQTTASGRQLIRITEENPLQVGDKVVVRLTVRSDRDLEFVYLKDLHAAAFEPVSQISGISRQNGIPCYQTSKDASTGFYFDSLPRGTYLFEYAVYVSRPGSYSGGIATIRSMYAPEFTAHTGGTRINVKR